MTGKELQNYLLGSGFFKSPIPIYLVEIKDNIVIDNKVTSYFKCISNPLFEISLKYNHKEIYVNFHIQNCIHGYYLLSELTLNDLIKELDIFLKKYQTYIQWKMIVMREFNINKILSDHKIS